MKLITYNIRGLEGRHKKREVQKLAVKNKPGCLVFVED